VRRSAGDPGPGVRLLFHLSHLVLRIKCLPECTDVALSTRNQGDQRSL
jgi:hypothetical protein